MRRDLPDRFRKILRMFFLVVTSGIAGIAGKTTSPTAMRVPWSRHPEGVMRQWLVCGEFPSAPQQDGLDEDYLGGEAGVHPREGMTQVRPDGSQAVWTFVDAPADVVNLLSVFPHRPQAHVVAYAYTTLFRPAAGKALFLIGSDDGCKVWVNGAPVLERHVTRDLRPDSDRVEVTLAAGVNTVLLKIAQAQGGWGFTLRVQEMPDPLRSAPGKPNHTDSLAPAVSASQELLTVATDAAWTARRFGMPIKLTVIGVGGRVWESRQAMRGMRLQLDAARWPTGPYEIRCQATGSDGYPMIGHTLWYHGDALDAVKQLVATAPTAQLATTAPEMLHAILAAMLTVRLGEMATVERIPANRQQAICAILMEYAELLQDAQDHADGFVRLAYRDEVDDSPQFCRVYLPPDYTPTRTWPLVVNLHGKVTENPPYSSMGGMERRFDATADRYAVIMLYPYGRGNAFYEGVGEQDVLRCIAMAKQRFAVDDDRVYLTGYSMGGAGTWHVGTHHPELFAALGPIFGGREFRVTSDPKTLAQLSPTALYRLERLKSSVVNAESLFTTPVFVNQGAVDKTVPVGISRYGAGLLQQWGYQIRYWEHPGKGHRAPLGCEDTLMEWLLAQRLVAHPRQVRIRSGELRTAAAHWVRIDQRENPADFMYVDAEIVGPNRIRLDTQNVLQVTLTPGDALIDSNTPVTVTWNDKIEIIPATAAMTLRAPGYTPVLRSKRPELEGPVADIFLTPFAIVQGTIAPDPAMRQACERAAQAVATQWETEQHWRPRYFLDTELTHADAAKYSLLLIGGPSENLIASELAGQLPLQVTPTRITIGTRAVSVHDAAVQLIYPHPLNADRYVLVRTATSPAGMKFCDKLSADLDFSIADGVKTPWVAAGYFDNAWQIATKYVEWGR